MAEAPAPLPRVAVCLAAYNGMAWIEPQLSSILGQEQVEPRVFVSVDPSSDGTEKWLRDFEARDARVTILPAGPASGGAAQNFFRLLREADFTGCDYVCLADQDDIWLPGKLARAVARLRLGRAQACSSDVIAFWPDGRRRLIRKAQPQKPWDHLFESPGPGCTFVFAPELVAALQGFLAGGAGNLRNIALHDWLIYAFARTRGFKWIIDDQAGLLYRQHDHNVFGANRGWRAFRRRTLMVLQGWHLKQARLIARAVGADEIEFVQRTLFAGAPGYFRLAWSARLCRRRPVDQGMLALSCLMLGLRELFTGDRGA